MVFRHEFGIKRFCILVVIASGLVDGYDDTDNLGGFGFLKHTKIDTVGLCGLRLTCEHGSGPSRPVIFLSDPSRQIK